MAKFTFWHQTSKQISFTFAYFILHNCLYQPGPGCIFLRLMPVHIIINFLSSNIYSDDKILRWIQSSSNLPISCFELIFTFIGGCFFFILSIIKERIATAIPSVNTTKAVKILSKAISLKSFSLHAFSEGLKRFLFRKYLF